MIEQSPKQLLIGLAMVSTWFGLLIWCVLQYPMHISFRKDLYVINEKLVDETRLRNCSEKIVSTHITPLREL